jgi:hypothetical protein
MGIVGRFTRDEVSAKVWWPLALILLVLVVLTFPGEGRAVESARETYGAHGEPVISRAIDQVEQTWLASRIVLASGFLVTFFFALMSIREPKARIGAGVKFYPESVPPYLALIDADEAEQLRQLGSYARRRVNDLQDRISSMESEKLELEGEVQRLLSAAAAKGLFHAVPPTGMDPGEGVVVVVPEAGSEGLAELPETGERPAHGLAPSAVPAGGIYTGPPPAGEKPAEMLARMVEPVTPAPASEADRADLRARLERTAALKKPGSKERREERERGEGPDFT